MNLKFLAATLLSSALLLGACTSDKPEDTKGETETKVNNEFAMDIPLEQLFTDNVQKEFAESVINTPLQDFELESVYTGEKISNKTFEGKPFIVKYAFTGCSACQKSQPEIEKFIEKHNDIPIIQIFNEQDTKEKIDDFLILTNTFEHDYMLIDNKETSFAVKHNANYTPALFFVDHTGVIRFATIGSVDVTRLEAYLDIAFKNLPEDVYTPRYSSNQVQENNNSNQ